MSYQPSYLMNIIDKRRGNFQIAPFPGDINHYIWRQIVFKNLLLLVNFNASKPKILAISHECKDGADIFLKKLNFIRFDSKFITIGRTQRLTLVISY